MSDWDASYKSIKGDIEEVDVSAGIAIAMSVKDDEEQVNL